MRHSSDNFIFMHLSTSKRYSDLELRINIACCHQKFKTKIQTITIKIVKQIFSKTISFYETINASDEFMTLMLNGSSGTDIVFYKNCPTTTHV